MNLRDWLTEWMSKDFFDRHKWPLSKAQKKVIGERISEQADRLAVALERDWPFEVIIVPPERPR